MQIQISWLLKKPTDLDLHCLQRQSISGFSRTRVKSHKYYYQIQGQMAITGIHRCILVGYTNRGIHSVTVNFDEDMWNTVHQNLSSFYKEYSRLSLSRIPRDSLKYFEISVVRHIRFAELRKK